MKIVILDGYTENPGDLSWAPLEALGELTVYDRTNVKDETEIIRRIGDAEIVLTNKTPISRSTLTACPSICFIAVLATGYNVVDAPCTALCGAVADHALREPWASSLGQCWHRQEFPLAGCIANALMEQEVPVRMTNFARILNELNNSFSGRNEVVDRLCRYPLLIIDDFGMERGTEYALEQIYNIVDSRYRSRKPLIVTTNLTLDEIRHPQDTAHARIYDRLLEMCIPISCIGVSLRKENAQEKLERLKALIG